MIRCLCCNKEISNPSKYESQVFWHEKCIKSFFGTKMLPELDCSDEELERLANLTVNKGLTVPGVQKNYLFILIKRTGAQDWQSGDFDYLPEAEYMSMKMAEAAKIKTVSNALIFLRDKYAYITRRIDRHSDYMLAMEEKFDRGESVCFDVMITKMMTAFPVYWSRAYARGFLLDILWTWHSIMTYRYGNI